jgi:hypothetical protein
MIEPAKPGLVQRSGRKRVRITDAGGGGLIASVGPLAVGGRIVLSHVIRFAKGIVVIDRHGVSVGKVLIEADAGAVDIAHIADIHDIVIQTA